MIARAIKRWRLASAPLSLARSRAVGWKRFRPAASLGPLCASPLPAAWSRSLRKPWVSPSSEARIWSGCTFGWELARGSVVPSFTGWPAVPGSISIVMSCSPVRGRSSRVASGWMSAAYLLSTSIVTTARPLSRFTLDTVPTLIPPMVICCPCPGVTAWALENSALSSKWS